VHNREARYNDIDSLASAAFVAAVDTITAAIPVSEEEARLCGKVVEQVGGGAPGSLDVKRNGSLQELLGLPKTTDAGEWRKFPGKYTTATYWRKVVKRSARGTASLLRGVSGTGNIARSTSGTFTSSVGAENRDVYGMGRARIDCSASECCAFVWDVTSYRNTRAILAGGSAVVYRKKYEIDGRNMVFVQGKRWRSVAVEPRFFSTWYIWRKLQDGSFLIVFNPINAGVHEEVTRMEERTGIATRVKRDISKDPKLAKHTVGTTTGFFHITPLAENVCEMTLTICGNLGGGVPEFVLSRRVVDGLEQVRRASERIARLHSPRPLIPPCPSLTNPPPQVALAKSRFERNGREVDREIRDASPPPPTLANLTADQSQLVADCVALEASAGSPHEKDAKKNRHRHARVNGGTLLVKSVIGGLRSWSTTWSVLESPTPFLKMWVKFQKLPNKKDKSTVVLGRAECVVDTSALDVCAFLNDYCSREQLRMSKEKRDRARVVVKVHSTFDKVVAIIRKPKYPLRGREFVTRMIAAVDDTKGHFLIISQSTDEDADYGYKPNCVRGTIKTILRIIPQPGKNGCKLIYTQYLDGGGNLPSYYANMSITKSLLFLDTVRSEFKRDGQIDEEERKHIEQVMDSSLENPEEADEYSSEENLTISRMLEFFGKFKKDDYAEIETVDPFVRMYMEGGLGSSIVLKAESVVDADITNCASYEFNQMSRHRYEKFFDSVGLHRSVTKQNEHSFFMCQAYKYPYMKARQFVNRVIWKWLDETKLILVFEGLKCREYPLEPDKYIRADAQLLWTFTKLPDIGDMPQTSVRFDTSVDLKGSAPAWLLAREVPELLANVSHIRTYFDQSARVDQQARAAVHRVMESSVDFEYSEEELAVINRGKAVFERFDPNVTEDFKKVISDHPSVLNKISFNKDNSDGLGLSETHVRASKFTILEYMWAVDARCRWVDDDIARDVLEKKNVHSQIVYQCKKGSGGRGSSALPKDWVSHCVWYHLDNNTVLYSGVPADHHLRPAEGKDRRSKRASSRSKRNTSSRNTSSRGGSYVIRLEVPVALKIKEISKDLCKVIYVSHLQNANTIGYNVNATLPLVVSVPRDLREYFLATRTLGDYDEDDGRALGLALYFTKKKNMKYKKLWEVCESFGTSNVGMKALFIEYPWLLLLLQEIVKGRLHLAKSVSTQLKCISEAEARKIGSSLSPALRQRKTAEAGLYQWKMQNPCMVELFEEHPFMESFLLTLSQEVLKKAPWGLIWRVCTGAGMSILDMASDISIIVVYLRTEGQETFGWLILGMLLFCLSLQIGVVYLQNRGQYKAILIESAFVLSGLKPGVDALRVASNEEMKEYHAFHPKIELVAIKTIEMFCESIPGCVIQVKKANLRTCERGRAQRYSFASSLSSLPLLTPPPPSATRTSSWSRAGRATARR